MGLSNRERTGKILVCVREIVEKAESLKESLSYYNTEKLQRIINFCGNLWPALLSEERNSGHWIMGSSSSNTVDRDNEDLWSIAVCSSLPVVSDGVIRKDTEIPKGCFNPFKDALGIEDLLHSADRKDIAIVFEIYQFIEEIIYALRRYDDDYLKSKKEFSDLVCNLQGTCFSVFYDNPTFSECFVAHEICGILYTDHYVFKEDKYKDVVDEWLHSDCIHHHITRVVGREGEPVDWLVQQHVLLLAADGAELKRQRVLVALRMSGRRFHYEHSYKKMLEILKKDKDLNDPNFLSLVDQEFKNCVKAHETDEKFSRDRYKEEHKPSFLYGYDCLPKKVIQEKKITKKGKK